jgi:hypothetical protein
MTDDNLKIVVEPLSNTEKDPDDWVSGDDAMTGDISRRFPNRPMIRKRSTIP